MYMCVCVCVLVHVCVYVRFGTFVCMCTCVSVSVCVDVCITVWLQSTCMYGRLSPEQSAHTFSLCGQCVCVYAGVPLMLLYVCVWV